MRKILPLIFTMLLATACHDYAKTTPFLEGFEKDKGPSENITPEPDPVPGKTLVECPATEGTYKFINAIDPEKGAVTEPEAPPAPAFTIQGHIGGVMSSIAAYDGTKFYNIGSTLYAGDKKIEDLKFMINSIAVAKLADESVVVAVGTNGGLALFSLNPSTKELTKLGYLTRLDKVTSVAIANSSDHNSLSATTTKKPLEGLSLSLNVTEDGSLTYSSTFADFIYFASGPAVYRIRPGAISCGCIEEVWRTNDEDTTAIKIIAENDAVAVVSETSKVDIAAMSEADAFFYFTAVFRSKSVSKNSDTLFLFNRLLWPDANYRKVHLISTETGKAEEKDSGTINDIAMADSKLFIAKVPSANASPDAKTVSESLAKSALLTMEGLAALAMAPLYALPNQMTAFDLPTGEKEEIVLSMDVNGDKSIYSTINKLSAMGTGIVILDPFGYVMKYEDGKFETIAKQADVGALWFPYQTAYDAKADIVIATTSVGDGLIEFSPSSKKVIKTPNPERPINVSEGGNYFITQDVDGYSLTLVKDTETQTKVADFAKGSTIAMAEADSALLFAEQTATAQPKVHIYKQDKEDKTYTLDEIPLNSNFYVRDIEKTDKRLMVMAQKIDQNKKESTYTFFNALLPVSSCQGTGAIYVASNQTTFDTSPHFAGHLASKDGKAEALPFIAGGSLLWLETSTMFFAQAVTACVVKDTALSNNLADAKMIAPGTLMTIEKKSGSIVRYSASFDQQNGLKLTNPSSVEFKTKITSAKIVALSDTRAIVMAYSKNSTTPMLVDLETGPGELKINTVYPNVDILDIAGKDNKIIMLTPYNGLEIYQ